MFQKDREQSLKVTLLGIMSQATQDLSFEIPQSVQISGHNLRIQTKKFTFFHFGKKRWK